MKNIYYAKSVENGSITVNDHSVSTKNFAIRCCDRIIKKDALWYDYSFEKLRNSVGKTSIFHDILKVSKTFQNNLSKSSNNDDSDDLPLTHDVMSWGFLKNNTDLDDDELRTILYHHVLEGDDNLSADDICYKISEDGDEESAKEMFEYLKENLKQDGIDVNLTDYKADEIKISSVSMYPKVRDLSSLSGIDRLIKCHLLRSLLIYSDRTVSKLHKNVDDFVSNNFEIIDNIIDESMLSNGVEFFRAADFNGVDAFDKKRLAVQDELVGELLKQTNSILMANTGFGKTLVGLKWWCLGNKKLFWVTPTTSIAENAFREINKILSLLSIKEKVSVALLASGKYREGDENSDIIVSVIDSFLGRNVKNNAAHQLLNTLVCDAVFDEFQDYTNANPLFASFISMCGARLRFTNSRTLLLSATPPMYHNLFWGDDNVKLVNFGVYDKNKKIKINIKKINSIEELNVAKDSISVFNTIPNSQKYCENYGKYDETILLHTLFPQKDKDRLLDEVLNNRSKTSIEENRKTVFGTNMIGVGCDISAHEINDIVISPENTIQRCGRANRFGEYEEAKLNCIIFEDKAANMFLKSYYGCEEGMKIYFAWCDFLMKMDGKTLNNQEFYECYSTFCKENRALLKKYWKFLFVESSSSYSTLKPYRSSSKQSRKIISSRPNFRGINNDIYVKAHKSDGTISDTMQIPFYKLGDAEKTIEAAKTHIKFFKENMPKNIYLYKYGMRNHTDEMDENKWAEIAKNEETPLLLHAAILDEKLGLLF